MDLCRLCLNDTENMLNESPIHEYQDLILECLNLTLHGDESITQRICNICLSKLRQWQDFKSHCFLNQNLLIENLLPNSSQHPGGYAKVVTKESSLTIEDINRYNCEICLENFTDCFDYLDHQIVHNGQNDFRCSMCGQRFDQRNQLVEHENKHEVKCTQCNKLLIREKLTRHMRLHLEKHKCTICEKNFTCSSELKVHVDAVHLKKKSFECRQCSKMFSKLSTLKEHMKIHSVERLFNCKECNYTAKTVAALYIHKSVHLHENHECDSCGKIFKSRRNLADHLRRVHAVKKYKCAACDKCFVDKYLLEQHSKTHTGEKIFECTFCGKNFSRKERLKAHTLAHK